MGKPTDGTNAGTVDWGVIPFPVLKNPKICIVTFAGIIRTPLGVSLGVPAAPNKNFFPERIDCTGWHYDDDTWSLIVNPDLRTLDLTLVYPVIDIPSVFAVQDPQHANFSADNLLLEAEIYAYIGGQMSITWMEHYGPDSSWFLMDAFGLDYSDPTMLEQIPQLNRKAITRFADRKDGTCIRITLDKDWGVFLPVIHWWYTPATHDLKVQLWFPKDMLITSTPLPRDFIFCNYYEDEIVALSCVWLDSRNLELHFTTTAIPTEDSWINYNKGIHPLTFWGGSQYEPWNHMYFPDEFL